jgi:hypothetical protein
MRYTPGRRATMMMSRRVARDLPPGTETCVCENSLVPTMSRSRESCGSRISSGTVPRVSTVMRSVVGVPTATRSAVSTAVTRTGSCAAASPVAGSSTSSAARPDARNRDITSP